MTLPKPIKTLINLPFERYTKIHKTWTFIQISLLIYLVAPTVVLFIWVLLSDTMPFENNRIYKLYDSFWWYLFGILISCQAFFLIIGRIRINKLKKQLDEHLKKHNKH